ncbi:hypothetical protein SAMN06265219_11395 [Gracilimonas mengyeensis]|uniref:Uncharacterized protein n=1 Tax=Gracilimonas mengyeensis TaxID=1302730 RepID=A0A521ES80_9BACT|nr:hypothetical protein SAMN06265219_11395 [Gracilimonas mengyeensis]
MLVFGAMVSGGCDVQNSQQDSGDFEQIYSELKGIWQPVSSQSERPVDANFDGVSSTNMLDELTNSQNYTLSVRILKKEESLTETDYRHVLAMPYSVQVFPVEASPKSADFYINYIMNVVTLQFEVNQAQDAFILNPKSASEDQEKHPFPESITLTNNRLTIEVTMQKELYTASGWHTVTIKTRYSRISETT